MRATNRARELRRDSTPAEKILWRALRGRRIKGAKFRRQRPIGPFIVDFVCLDHSLVVEVDGGQHADSAYDARRSRYLPRQGYRVIRFWNGDVLGNADGVVARIAEELDKSIRR